MFDGFGIILFVIINELKLSEEESIDSAGALIECGLMPELLCKMVNLVRDYSFNESY